MVDRARERMRFLTYIGYKFPIADGQLWSTLDCWTWYRWGFDAKQNFARGLAIGLTWWMKWEEEIAKDKGLTDDAKAWERAWQVIPNDAVWGEIQKELENYCENYPSHLFLDAVPKTIWSVAKRHGAPLPELEKE